MIAALATESPRYLASYRAIVRAREIQLDLTVRGLAARGRPVPSSLAADLAAQSALVASIDGLISARSVGSVAAIGASVSVSVVS